MISTQPTSVVIRVPVAMAVSDGGSAVAVADTVEPAITVGPGLGKAAISKNKRAIIRPILTTGCRIRICIVDYLGSDDEANVVATVLPVHSQQRLDPRRCRG